MATIPLPMLAAARDGKADTLRDLLQHGIEGTPCLPDACNVIGQTCLHFAAMWGHAEAVLVLLDAGADVNITNEDGIAPLDFAIRKGHTEVVQILLDRGVKIRKLRELIAVAEQAPNGKQLKRQLELHTEPRGEITKAVKALALAKLEALLASSKLLENEEWEDARERTPLHHAVLTTIAVVEQRVEQDEDDIFGSNDGVAALEMLVQALEAQGKDQVREVCSILDDSGKSPLHYLAEAGLLCHPTALGVLLRAGADPNVQSTPRETAYTNGQWGRTTADGEKQVLRGGADRTPLHMTLESEDTSPTVVGLLLEHGADPNVRDNEQRTALHIALDFEEDRGGIDLAVCELLLKHGADPNLGSRETGMANGCLHAAVTANEMDVVKLVLRFGAPHSAPGKGGWVPLAIAARSGNAAAVEALLAAGADPDALTPTGKTVRELATINKKDRVLQALKGGAAATPRAISVA
jgi:ankyrin repeat protein